MEVIDKFVQHNCNGKMSVTKNKDGGEMIKLVECFVYIEFNFP